MRGFRPWTESAPARGLCVAGALCFFLGLAFTASPAFAAIIHVPADQPTIAQGLAIAAAEDTVLVACGTYYESGLVMAKGACLRSETGLPDCVTIDATGTDRHIRCTSIDGTARIEGFTFVGGDPGDDYGGAIYCQLSSLIISHCVFTGNLGYAGGSAIYLNHSDVLMSDCVMINNQRAIDGGAVYCNGSNPTLIRCLIAGNRAMFWGGAVFCQQSSPYLLQCTLAGNSAYQGGGIWAVDESHPRLEQTVVAFAGSGTGLWMWHDIQHPSDVTLSCCDVYGNVGGEYGGDAVDQTGINGNIAQEPFFCDASADDYSLASISPCLPEHNECGLLMGALGEGCTPPAGIGEDGFAEIQPVWMAPSPFRPGGTIYFRNAHPRTVSASIHDPAGRMVRRLMDGVTCAEGVQSVSWDGRDDHGRLLAPGVYFLRIGWEDGDRAVKLILAR